MVIRTLILSTILLISSCWSQLQTQSNSAVLKQWNLINYNFEWNAPINDKNFYNSENVVSTGLAISGDRIFVATPRLFSGVPATISTVSRDQIEISPILEAYPNWSFHTVSIGAYNCSDLGLVSVYRLKIDSCNRLWALDAGVSRSLEDYEITCPPKILIFDLAINQVVRRIDFPREVRRGETLFTNLIIDETTSKPENKCDDVFVYISDTVEPALVVYDSARDLTWRVSHPSMFPDPDFAESQIKEHKFTLMDGVVGMGFDPKAGLVYFQPLATDRIFSISTEALRAGPFPRNQALPVKLVGRKSSQGIGLAASSIDGSIFFSPLTETAVASWNPISGEQRVLAYDQEALQFVADIAIVPDDPTAIYVVSSKFHRYFLKNVNPNEPNTRIIRIETLSNGGPSPKYLRNSVFGTIPATNRPTTPYTFDGNYFRGDSSPYAFGTAGYSSKAITNPFVTGLNTGERALSYQSTTVLPSTSYSTFTHPGYGGYKGFHYIKRSSKIIHR